LPSVLGDTPLAKKIIQGTAGHNPRALRYLRQSVREVLAADHRFKDHTELVVTGDLSTWGDDASVTASRTIAESIAADSGLRDPIIIYGNHDVWPAQPGSPKGFPLFTNVNMGDRRTTFRKTHFPTTNWPFRCASHPIPGTGRNLTLCSLNTILHGRIRNTLAQGDVTRDRFWEQPQGDDQLGQLGSHLQPADIGIVLTHHPVHDPMPMNQATVRWLRPAVLRNAIPHALSNANEVANALKGNGLPKHLVHVVLSGHTHQVFPFLGDSAQTNPHTPLEISQLQLTAGTASQIRYPKPPGHARPAPPSGTRAVEGHSWQLLHFYWMNSTPPKLGIERMVYERSNDAGPFRPAASGNDPAATADFFELPIL